MTFETGLFADWNCYSSMWIHEGSRFNSPLNHNTVHLRLNKTFNTLHVCFHSSLCLNQHTLCWGWVHDHTWVTVVATVGTPIVDIPWWGNDGGCCGGDTLSGDIWCQSSSLFQSYLPGSGQTKKKKKNNEKYIWWNLNNINSSFEHNKNFSLSSYIFSSKAICQTLVTHTHKWQ